jgi:EpsI family protein
MALAVMISSVVFVNYRARMPDVLPKAKQLAAFPLQMGAWQGQQYLLEKSILRKLDLTDYFKAIYHNDQSENILFYVAWYDSQSKGESIHSPETCLRGGGWQFSEGGEEALLHIPGYEESPIRAHQSLLTRANDKVLACFWFVCRGRNLVNGYELKLFNMWDKLTKRRTDGALIEVMSGIDDHEGVDAAQKRIQSFLSHALPVLDTFLPYGS